MKNFGKRLILGLTLIFLPIICVAGVLGFYSSVKNNYDIEKTMSGDIVSLISGEFYGTNVADSNHAFDFLQTVANEYGIADIKTELLFDKTVEVTNGLVYKFSQIKNNILVYGRGISVTVDHNGRVLAISGNYKKSNAEIFDIDIEKLNQSIIDFTDISQIITSEIVVYNQGEEDAFAVKVNCIYDGEIKDIILDVKTLEFYQITDSSAQLSSLNGYTLVNSEKHEQVDSFGQSVELNVETYKNILNQSVYLLSDSTKNIYMCIMNDGKTINDSNFFQFYLMNSSLSATDSMVVEAYKNLITCYDFYADAGSFGTSIKGLKNEAGNKIKLYAVVHAVESVGKSYDNAAYWILNSNSSFAYFLFGDGGSFAEDYPSALDVVGHEYQHGITTSVCNLEYLNEAGAINEAISDIFGALIEDHEIADDDFWLMGEDITISNIAFRDMKNPKNPFLADEYPESTYEMYPLCQKKNCSHATCDYGGVHYNSVILTHMTYKMYSLDNEFFTKYRIGELWYNTLTRLSVTSTFADFRIQMLGAAQTLGYEESKINLINRAFAEVGIIAEGAEYKVNFYESQEDAESGENLISSITGVFGSTAVLPSASKAPENKLFYYWTDGTSSYMPGSKFEFLYEDYDLWAVYVTYEEISNLDITLKGSGTITNPYLIYSSVEFVYLSTLINSPSTHNMYKAAEYDLKADIYLNNLSYTPIGATEEYAFEGSFGGGNHTIYDLNLSKTGYEYMGLFGVNYGSIYNLAIGLGDTQSNSEYTGSVAGVSYGNLSNCSSGLSISSNGTVGGLVGLVYSNNNNAIINSFTEGNISGNIVGGIAGICLNYENETYNQVFSSYIGNVFTTGDITGSIVGGIAGISNGFYFVNCITTGTIKVADDTSGSIAGGVVGYMLAEAYDGQTILSNESYGGILSAKVVSDIQTSGETTSGMLIGKLYSNSNMGYIILENNTIKNHEVTAEIGNYDSLSIEFKNKINNDGCTITSDGIYEGKFDFDNPDYYFNANNWSVTRGISLYNLESVWTIVETKQMPRIVSYEFWINYAASNFSGGEGTASKPFLISTAEELALLSALINSGSYFRKSYFENVYFTDCYYKLISDIDLTGKIWVGIGVSITEYNAITNKPIETEYLGFNGCFDGDGHTITGMNSMAAYSAEDISSNPNDGYYVYEYNAGLFSLVGTSLSNSPAIIENFHMRKVSVSGSFAAAVVSQAIESIKVINVKVHSGTISGSSVAGSIIGVLGDNSLFTVQNNSLISGCMNNAKISSRIAGGIVGFVGNNANGILFNTNLIIDTTVNRGELLGFGDNLYNEQSYAGVYLGGLIGVVACKNVGLYNNIYDGKIYAYNDGFIGGLIGTSSYMHNNNSSTVNIVSSHNKLTGKIEYKFRTDNCVSGVLMASKLENSISNVVITDTSSSSTISGDIVGVSSSGLTINADNIYSTDNVGEGVFDYYANDYYGSINFDSTYAWNSNSISSMIITVYFVDHAGNSLGYANTCYGGTLGTDVQPLQEPSPYSDKYNHYTFNRWEDYSGKVFDQNGTINAIYTATPINYNISYQLMDGTIIYETTGTYDSKISQNVKAPEKKGNFFIDYDFAFWDFESDTVIGDMVGIAVYQITLGKGAVGLIVLIVIVLIVISSIRNFKRRNA